MEIQTEKGLKEALHFLETADPVQAQLVIAKLFEHELGCEELSYTNRCCTFWIETSRRLSGITNSYEKGQQLLLDWKTFKEFLKRDKFVYRPALYAAKKGYFTAALEYYTKPMDEKDPFHRAEIYMKAGICYKKLGAFRRQIIFTPIFRRFLRSLQTVFRFAARTVTARYCSEKLFFWTPKA